MRHYNMPTRPQNVGNPISEDLKIFLKLSGEDASHTALQGTAFSSPYIEPQILCPFKVLPNVQNKTCVIN